MAMRLTWAALLSCTCVLGRLLRMRVEISRAFCVSQLAEREREVSEALTLGIPVPQFSCKTKTQCVNLRNTNTSRWVFCLFWAQSARFEPQPQSTPI